jgi:hypothetical protein
MKTVVLISCTKSKRDYPCEARLLYDPSAKFKKSLAYAKTISEDIYVISAKHGLLALDAVIAPYDETLIGKSKAAEAAKVAWAKTVAAQIGNIYDIQNTEFVIFAGSDYYAPLQDHLPHIQLPLRGLRQGESLAKLNELLGNSSR